MSSGPQPPSYRTATWAFVLADFDLANVAFLTPHPDSVRYTRRLNGYCELSIAITDRDDLNALQGSAYTRVLRAWRNGVNRFNGQVVEVRESANTWEIVAKDPYFNLNWREIRVPVTYTAQDAGDIAWELINLQNSYRTTNIVEGTINTSTNRTRKYATGQRVSETIEYLAKLPNGFAFTIDAVEGGPAEWAEFNVHYPYGVELDDVRFEFGGGTLENCYDFLREPMPLVNRANITGANGLVVSAESAYTYLYGLWEETRGQVLTDDTTTLSQIASAQITNAPSYAITMMAGPDAPQLFTDFDVGDSVRILIRRLGRTLTGVKLVTEATVVLDPNSGAEELESIELIDQPEDLVT